MQIVSLGDNLHEMSNLIFWEKYHQILSAELALRVVKVKCSDFCGNDGIWYIIYFFIPEYF